MPTQFFNVFLQHKSPLWLLLGALLAYCYPDLIQWFEYDRDAINQYQFWRLLTGHFYHTNSTHLLLNCFALVLLWSMHGHFYTATSYAGLFFTTALLTSLGLYEFSSLTLYVGLSGILHGFFVWGALNDTVHQEKTGYLLLAGVTIKLIHEQIYGASDTVAALIDANVAIDAHLYGAIAGLFYFFIERMIRLKYRS